jgi:hypothetical protein
MLLFVVVSVINVTLKIYLLRMNSIPIDKMITTFEGNNIIKKLKTAISYVLHQLTNGKA